MQLQRYSGNRIFSIFIMVLLLFPNRVTIKAQMLYDTAAIDQVSRSISHIYNSEFDLAEKVIDSINSKYPGHPATYLLKGFLINWENYPLLPFSPARKSYESQLQTSFRIAEAEDGWSDNPEMLLISLCSRGLLMLLYSENKMSSELIPYVPTTYRGIRKAFEYTSVFADLCYYTGLYNYYREAYPEQHPIYKAVAFLFPHGDKEKGLEELIHTAENAILLGPEAYSILSWICIQYENDFQRALYFSETVFNQYPENPWFRAEYLKNLFLVKDYEKAEEIIRASSGIKNAYFTCQLAIFKGLLQEKKYNDYVLAEDYYQKAVRCLEYYGPRGETFREFGTDGLERVEDLQAGKWHERRRKKKDRGFSGVKFDD
jgi:hypothetical protein